MPAGLNTLAWRYIKDPVNTSTGDDAAYIDNVELPKTATGATSATSIRLQRLDDGCVQLTVRGPADQPYAIEASNDLVTWETVFQGDALKAGASFLDSKAGSYQTRFYRVTTLGST